MFTGLVQGIGLIKSNLNGKLDIETDMDIGNCQVGSSIACNGVCLTIINIKKNISSYIFSVELSEETTKRTNFKNLSISEDKINLEQSLKVGDEIGGHFVYGHVDLVTNIIEIIKNDNSWDFVFDNKSDFFSKDFIVEKGSITVNGISLTISSVQNASFKVSVIPQTYYNTNFQYSKINDCVNLEYDYLARFILNKNNV